MSVACSQRGLLLFRVRNEIRAYLATLDALASSGAQFGLSKAAEGDSTLMDKATQVSLSDADPLLTRPPH